MSEEKEEYILVRKMPNSVFCGRTSYGLEFYFPKEIKNEFTDSYDSEKVGSKSE